MLRPGPQWLLAAMQSQLQTPGPGHASVMGLIHQQLLISKLHSQLANALANLQQMLVILVPNIQHHAMNNGHCCCYGIAALAHILQDIRLKIQLDQINL